MDLAIYRTILIAFINKSLQTVTFYVDTSEDGEAVDTSQRNTIEVASGEQGSLEIGPHQLRRYYRVSASSEDSSDAEVRLYVNVSH